MRRFKEAGAIEPVRAKSLDELGCRGSLVFNRLVGRGVFVETSPGRYYIDVIKADAFRSRRRAYVLMAVVIAVGVILILQWIR